MSDRKQDPLGAPPASVAAVLARNPQLAIVETVAHAKAALQPWLDYGRALASDSKIDPLLRELAMLRVASLVEGGDYVWSQHEPIARSLDATSEQIDAARGCASADPTTQQALALVDQVCLGEGVDEQLVREVVLAIGSRAAVELVLSTADAWTSARIAATFHLDPEASGAAAFRDPGAS